MSTHQLLFLHPPPTKQPGSLAGVGREGAAVQIPTLAWGQVSLLACSIWDKTLRERTGTWTDRWPQDPGQQGQRREDQSETQPLGLFDLCP